MDLDSSLLYTNTGLNFSPIINHILRINTVNNRYLRIYLFVIIRLTKFICFCWEREKRERERKREEERRERERERQWGRWFVNVVTSQDKKLVLSLHFIFYSLVYLCGSGFFFQYISSLYYNL